jgi:hypothetical protein
MSGLSGLVEEGQCRVRAYKQVTSFSIAEIVITEYSVSIKLIERRLVGSRVIQHGRIPVIILLIYLIIHR